MICNKVQILPTTLNNQSKPNFPSLEGQRVYKSRTNRKRSVSLLIHVNFPDSSSDELWYHPCFFDRKTKAQNSHLLLHSKSIRRLKGCFAHRCPRCCKNFSQHVFPQQPSCLVPFGKEQDPAASAEGLRSTAGCRVCQLVYVLDIFKYINGPSLLCIGNWITSFVTTVPQKSYSSMSDCTPLFSPPCFNTIKL